MLTVEERARAAASAELRSRAVEIDRDRRYPAENLATLSKDGLAGLLVPEEHGGHGGTLSDLVAVTEALGWGCASTAMCYLMHACGTAVIAAKATKEQGERWLRPAANGDAIATLAFSERGTGAHFYAPEITATSKNGSFILSGRKSFVTSGGHASLYPVLVNATDGDGLDVIVVTPEMRGVAFDGAWDGIGMAGNSSIAMLLTEV
ncbi:MAG: acyl-CoA dehydrogenase family protein, partial [Actinomycetota bacterium]